MSDSEGESAARKEEFIKVSVRIRPPDENLVEPSGSLCLQKTDPTTISLFTSKKSKNFAFDVAFDAEATQEYVFTSLGKYIVDGCIDGYNGTIFAYGQTGSGKTYTMVGPSDQETGKLQRELRGLIPRSLEYLFMLIQRKKELSGDSLSFLCRCTFVELYQEQVYDLLDPSSTAIIREDLKKGVYVQGAQEDTVSSADEAFQVLMKGWRNRRVASTAMNRESSRSHAIFAISIESRESKGTVQNMKVARLNLVDLAGSERQKDASTGGQRLKEAGSINNSLLVLGKVINSLVGICQGKQKFVPYRDSRLTFLLRDSLGGNARTCIVCNVHPHVKCYGESLSTLQFAESAKKIRNKAVVNEDVFGQGVSELRAEIVRLTVENRRLLQGQHVYRSPPLFPSSSSEAECSGQTCLVPEADLLAALTLLKREEAEKESLGRMMKILQQCNSGKDKQLLSCQLILKLRDSRIQSLEKALREREITPPIRDALTSSLLDEVDELKNLLKSQPTPIRLKQENEELRRQLSDSNALTEEGKSYYMRRLNQWKLERDNTPSLDFSNGGRVYEHEEENVVVEIDDLKHKNQKQEYEIERLRKELEESRTLLLEETERNKKNLEEVKRSMAAGNIRRELINTIQEDVIKALTPPAAQTKQAMKSARKARRTTLFTPGTGSTELPEAPAGQFTPKSGLLRRLGHNEGLQEDTAVSGSPNGQVAEHIRQLQKLIAEQEDVIAKLEADKLTIETDSNRLQQQVNERQTRINTVQEESEKREVELCQNMADMELKLRAATEIVAEWESAKGKHLEMEKRCLWLEKEQHTKQKQLDFTLEKHRQELSKLENEAFSRVAELNSVLKERDEAVEEKTELRKQLDNQSSELESVREELDKTEKTVKKLKEETSRIRNLRSSHEPLKVYGELEELKLEKEEAEKMAEQKSEELKAAQLAYMEGLDRERFLKSEVDRLKSGEESSNRALEEAEMQNEEMSRLIDQLRVDLSSVREELEAAAEKDKIQFQKRISALESQLATAKINEKRIVEEKDDLNIALKKEIEELKAEFANASAAMPPLMREMECLKLELDKRRSFSNDGEDALETELQCKEEECDRLKKLNEESCRLIAEFQASAAESAKELEKMRLDMEAERESFKETRRTLDKKQEEEIRVLEKEIQAMKKRVAASVNVSSDIKKSNEQFKEMIQRLRGDADIERVKCRELEDEIQGLKEAYQRVQSSEERMFKEKKDLQSELRKESEETLGWKKKFQGMCENLNNEMHKNTELAGHANQNQKIKYLEKLREQVKKLNEENAELKQKISNGAANGRRGSTSVPNRGKENTQPRK